jgi:HNH endonuclease
VIRAEFGAGRLSYAKVRALTRIAAPDTEAGLADALLVLAEAFLAEKVAAADDPEVYQVIVHVGTDAMPAGPPADPAAGRAADAAAGVGGVSAETPAGAPARPARPARPPGHPAGPARCHVEDGPAISVSTAQMIACSSSLSWMLHDSAGKLLDLGRRRRRPNAALRRAARERDNCRCRFPGCESRRIDLHHIQYWSNRGRTSLDNLIGLCRYHHRLVHERGYLIAAARDGTFTVCRPDGTAIPASPPLPRPDGTIGDCHDADITPETIIPPWYGERLDLDHAIYVCLANAANTNAAGQASQHDNGPPPVPAAA